MGLSPDFLEILRCPACKERIEATADGSALKCVGCRRVYPVRDDIPILIVEEATIEKEEATA
ncbi:MAG: Trm112 family protein [Blastocatellia bacterium]|nr:Trm112 family protein [Blastocatellia bacterium]